MKHELLTIGEASTLKGVSPKSLRYYERIGILEPAVVDPQTGYRYYGMNQMLDLDVIITCIELGIPLKTLVEYKNAGGSLDIASLLERGRATALERIRKASARLAQIDSCLREIEQQKALKAQAGGYTRRLGARPIMYAPWPGDAFDAKRYLSLTAGLYAYAAHEGAVPLYLWGMARAPLSEGGRWRVFVEIAPGTGVAAFGGASDGTMPGEDGAVQAGGAGSDHACRPGPRALQDAGPAQSEASGGSTRASDDGASEDARPDHRAFGTATLEGGLYRGRRLQENGFEHCFHAVFAQAAAIEGAVVATEIWDAEIDASKYAVELLERCEA